MFQFSCRCAFFIYFSSFKPDTENNANFEMLYQANTATMTPFSKEDKILIKNPHECTLQRSAVCNSFQIEVGRRTASTGCW